MTQLKIFSLALRRRRQTKKKTGPEINHSLAKTISTLMRQKPDDDCDNNIFNNIGRPENCEDLSKITVNQVI